MPIRKSSKSLVNQGNTASRPSTPVNGDVYSNTETGFIEVYSSVFGWEQVGGISSTPLNLTATNIGTNRAFNNGQASVAFTPGTIAGRSYTVTSSPGGYTGTGTSSPILVSGLASNISYTYTATATNNYGTSSASSASAGVIATTVPQAPTIGTATAGSQSATLTFTAGANGGSAITNYKYSTDNITYTAFSPAQTTSPLTISGLTDGQSYSFYLKAVNANGDSAASGVSNSVVPASNSFESIATQTVTGSPVTSLTFSNIPQTYTHLQLRMVSRDTGSDVNGSPVYMYFNSDTSSANYGDHTMYGDGSTVTAIGYQNFGGWILLNRFPNPSYNASIFGALIADIWDYRNTNKNKTVRSYGGYDVNGTGGRSYYNSGVWVNTSAITSLTVNFNNAGLAVGSSYALYGIRGE